MTGPLRPCLELDKFRDDLTTNPVTSVYAALGRLKAEYPALSWGEVKELHVTTQCYAFARVLDGKAWWPYSTTVTARPRWNSSCRWKPTLQRTAGRYRGR